MKIISIIICNIIQAKLLCSELRVILNKVIEIVEIKEDIEGS